LKKEAEFKGKHKKCSIDGCDKQGWRAGMCYRHWHIEHPKAKNSGGKKAIDKGKEEQQSRIRTGRAKAAPRAPESTADGHTNPGVNDVAALAAQVLADRDRLYYEMVKLESTLITLSKYKGIPLPDLKLLDGEIK